MTKWKRVRRVFKWIGIALLILIVTGAAINAWLEHRDDARFPPPGKMVLVGDHRLHLHCTGSGGPTVILEAGAGGWSVHGERLQRALERSVRVCTYDRAGLGWSESGPDQFDIATSARELHDLLRATNEPLPVILVGHSLGGNIAAYYAAHDPGDLAGAILIDPGTPEDMLEDFEGTEQEARSITSCGWKCGLASFVARVGVVRFAARKAGSKTLSAEENAKYRAGLAHARTVRTLIGVLVFLPKSALQMRESRNFGDVPMTIVYSSTRKPEGKETPADVVRWHALTMDRMRAILRGTTHGRGPIVVPDTNHMTVIVGPAGIATIASETMRLVNAHRQAPVVP